MFLSTIPVHILYGITMLIPTEGLYIKIFLQETQSILYFSFDATQTTYKWNKRCTDMRIMV